VSVSLYALTEQRINWNLLSNLEPEFMPLRDVHTLHITDCCFDQPETVNEFLVLQRPAEFSNILRVFPNISTLVISGFATYGLKDGYELPLRYEGIKIGSFPSRITTVFAILPEVIQASPETLRRITLAVQKLVMQHRTLQAPIRTLRMNIMPPPDDAEWFRREVETFEMHPPPEDLFDSLMIVPQK
jgi:hypothetical protein